MLELNVANERVLHQECVHYRINFPPNHVLRFSASIVYTQYFGDVSLAIPSICVYW
jgi:hypothetical protein